MEFHVLGPLEIVRHGRTLELGTGKQRALLAVLLLHANEVVSSDRLIDALWGQQAPVTAPKIVQGYVSRLRKALDDVLAQIGSGPGDGRILLTRAPGYVLRVEEGQLDSTRFETLLAQARYARRAGRQAKRRRSSMRRSGSGAARRSPSSRSTRLRRRRLPASRSSTSPPSRNESRQTLRSRATGSRRRARAARRPLSAARAATGTADARAVPLWPPGGGPAGLSGHPAHARRRLGLEPSRGIGELEQAILGRTRRRRASAPAVGPRPRGRSRASLSSSRPEASS